MTALVFVTQLLDRTDPNLGFVVPQMQVLAERVDRLIVVANKVTGPTQDLDFEVVTLGKEAGRGRAYRALRYEHQLEHILRTVKPSAILAHMCPVYLNTAWPLARAYRTPTMLWFVHSAMRPSLRLAGKLSDVVLTALPGSCGLPQHLTRVIGHAIDTHVFQAEPVRRSGEMRLLALGRTSPAKHYDDMIHATRLAREQGAQVSLRIAGPSLTEEEKRHRGDMRELVNDLGLATAVRIDGPVDRPSVPGAIASADVVVNAAESGNADKIVFEAMACRRPVLVSSPLFDGLIGDCAVLLRFPPLDRVALADRIVSLERLSSPALAAVGDSLREAVVRDHSLEHWADQVVSVVHELAARRSA